MPRIILILPDKKNRLPGERDLKKAGIQVSTALDRGSKGTGGQPPPENRDNHGTSTRPGETETSGCLRPETHERPWRT